MSDSTDEQSDYPDRRTARWAMGLLCTIVFFAVVNGNMINVALPYIGRDFEVSEGVYGWLVTGFIMTFGIFNAIHGRLANRFGLRKLYAFGVAVLGGTSILLALAPNIQTAIALRIVQGAGAAALPALGTVIVARLFPADRRGAAMGWLLACVGVAASIGPFLGGLLVDLVGWRLVFGVVAIVLLAIPAVWILLPESLDEIEDEPFDLIGAILLGAGISAWLYAFNVVERVGPGIQFVGLLVGGAVALAVFVWWIHRADDPFAAPEMFADLRYVANCMVGFLINATRFGTMVLVPIFLTEVNEVSGTTVGLVLLPGAFFIAVLSPRTGRLGDDVGARKPVLGGTSLIIAGNVVTALTAGGHVLGPAVGMGLYGLGFAFIQSPLVSAPSPILPRKFAGPGMGIFMMIFFLGAAFGVAISVTTVELQATGAEGWLGLTGGPGAIYSNGIFALTGLAILGLLFGPVLPGHRPRPPGEDDEASASSESNRRE